MANLQVTWNGATADWNTAADWSNGVVPNDSGTDATLGGTGGYTVTISAGEAFSVGSLAITDGSAALHLAGGHLTATGTVSNAGQLQVQGGASLTTTGDLSNSGGLYLDNGGAGGSSLTIGGTLSNSNFVQVGQGSLATTLTAQGLSNTGRIDIDGGSAAQAVLNIAAAAPSTWSGTLNISGMGLLEFGGTAGITAIGSNAQINLSGSQAFIAAAGLGTTTDTALTGLASNAGQLQLQGGASLTTTGDLTNSGGVYVNNGGAGGSSLTIGGTLSTSNFVQVGQGSLATTLSAQGLSNTGRIDIDGGSAAQAVLDIAAAAPSTWSGTLNISGMGLLEFGGTAGIATIASGAQINLYGSQSFIAAAGLGTTGDTALTGLATNAGQLQLQGGASLTTTGSLTNSGGVYVNNGGAGGASLTIGGTLSSSNFVQVGQGSLATTLTAQGLSNTGRIDIDGGSAAQAVMNIAAAAPSTWSGTLNISGMGLLEFGGTTGIATIASGAQINLYGSQSFIAAAGLGTTSDTALTGLANNAGQLQLQGGASLTTTGDLSNSGGVYVNNGGAGGASLTIGGTLSSSNFVQVGQGSLATTLTAQGLSNTGRIDIDGGSAAQAVLNIAAAAPSTWSGTLNISGMGLLEFGGTAGIATIASGAQINLYGSQSFIAAAGFGTTSDTALTGLATNAGQLQLQGGASLTTTGDLSNSGGVYVNNGGAGGASLTIGGTLSSSNFVQVGQGSLATTLTAQGLSNTGRIDIDGGSAAQAVMNIAAAAPSTWSGTLNISGMGLLEFGGTTGIATIASGAQINLYGSQSFIAAAGLGTTSDTALTGLATNAGQLQLQGGASLTTTGSLTNSGGVYVNNGGAGGASLTIGGTLSSSNFVQVGQGSLATTLSAQGLSNTGRIDIDGGSKVAAVFAVTAAAPSTWSGTLNISGMGLLEFGGTAGIATIASGAQINLYGSQSFIAAAGLGTTSDTALTGLATNAGQLQLQDGSSLTTTGGLTNSSGLYVDNGGTGGSTLTIGGTLSNSNTVQIGNNSSIQPSVVTAAALANTGNVTIGGDSSFGVTGNLTNSGAINIGATGLLSVAGTIAEQGSMSIAGALDILGNIAVTGAGTLTLAGGTITSADNSGLTIGAGNTVSGFGTVSLGLTNGGVVQAIGGTLDLTAPSAGAGQLSIAAGAVLELGDASSETVTFGGVVGTFKLDAPSRFSGTIAGLVAGDVIDLAGVAATSALISGNNLVVTTAGSQVFNYQVAGALAGNTFAIQSDGHGGSDLALTTQASTAQPFDAFYAAVNALTTDLADGAPPGQVPNDAVNVYITAVAGAIGTIGDSLWQQAYQNSTIAAGTVTADLANSGSSQQILNDTLGLDNTIVGGVVGAIAENDSTQSYAAIITAAGALGTDIANSAGNSKLLSDLTNLYGALAGSAAGTTNWQQAYNTSAQAAGTLSTDQANGAASAKILADVSALYDSIVSGSLNAIGGSSLQQAYQSGPQTVLTLGADIANGAGAAQIQSDVSGIYNSVVTAITGTTANAAATQNYAAMIGAANTLAGDIANNRSGLFATDAAELFNISQSTEAGAEGGGSAEQAYGTFANASAVLDSGFLRGASTNTLATPATAFLSQFLGPIGDAAWLQFQVDVTQAVSSLTPAVLQGGSLANQAALEFNATIASDLFEIPVAIAGTVTPAELQDAQTLAGDFTSSNGSDTILGDLGNFLSAVSSASGGTTGDAANSSEPLTQGEDFNEFVGDTFKDALGDALVDGGLGFTFGLLDGLEVAPAVVAGGELGLGAVAAVGALSTAASFGGFLDRSLQRLPPNDPVRKAGDGLKNAIGSGVYNGITGITGFLLQPIPYPPWTPGGQGDVHLTTFDGLYYNFQAEGEFVLAQSTQPGNSFQIQVRLQPWYTSASVSVMTMVAAQVGTDRVTFGTGRANTVMVDGTATTLGVGTEPVTLNGGQLTQLSPDIYQIAWNTGETATITNEGQFFNVSARLGANDGPGSVQGLLGPDEGQPFDFQLANGTVLQQPLTTAQLYSAYANAWRITQAASLMDYAPGQTTATFTDPNFPPGSGLTVAGLPQNLVAQAQALAAAAGITDPNILAGAELDYLATGDTSFLTGAANSQQPQGATTGANVTVSTPPAPMIGVNAGQTNVVQQGAAQQGGTQPGGADSAPTTVTFPVYLTSATTSDTVLDYAVVAPNPGDLGAAAFGGTFPSGQVTIPAGQTSGQFTIEVPAGALGSQPSAILQVQITAPNNPVFAATAQTTIVNNAPVAGPPAAPLLTLLTNVGTFTSNGNAYTLNLGALVQGQPLPVLQFALVNAASAPADSLSGTFGTPSGSGFSYTGTTLPTPIAAGQSYNGLQATVDTGSSGANKETLTFTPQDTNASGYSAALPTLSLTISDTAGAPAQATLNSPTTINFGTVRIGTTVASQAISLSNSATAPAASLDATVSPSGAATASGSISQLAPGATNSSSLMVGVNTGTAGAETGVVGLNLSSDLGSGATAALSSQFVSVSVGVDRLATASVTPLVVHVGDPGTLALSVTNSAAADGFSENLIASVVGTAGGVTSSGSTGDITPQATSTAVSANFSTATAGSAGSVTLDLKSDGTGIDGAAPLDLGQQIIPVAVDNLAQAAFEEISGPGTLTGSGGSYTLALGAVGLGSAPLSINLGVLNSAAGLADLLSGNFSVTGGSAFTNSGFGAFSGIGAGQADTAPTVTIATGNAGPFSETITLDPTGSNASGFSAALTPETLTITGNVQPCYCRGTLILTDRGEVPVEELAIGDRVMSVSGMARPIKWIGRRSYAGRFALGQKQILPVCVKTGALADGVPRRDLWVSPNHALYLEAVLIEARDLINGVSIFQAERVEAIEYFHIELDTHDVIVAEGAAAESFVDDDSRGLFHNAHEYRALYPDRAAGPARYCAPRRDQGCEVEQARAAIARRAGLAATAEVPPLGLLRGHIDEVGRRRICGWAQDTAHPEAPVCLDIHAGGEFIGQVVANRYRADLAAAGLGSGRHSFEFVPPPGLAVTARSIQVRRSLDGANLTYSTSLEQRLEQSPGQRRPRRASAG